MPAGKINQFHQQKRDDKANSYPNMQDKNWVNNMQEGKTLAAALLIKIVKEPRWMVSTV